MFLQRLHDAVVFLLHMERRFEPFFRPAVDAVLREPLAAATQALINLGRRDEGVRLAQETIQPDEEAHFRPSSTRWANTCASTGRPGTISARATPRPTASSAAR